MRLMWLGTVLVVALGVVSVVAVDQRGGQQAGGVEALVHSGTVDAPVELVWRAFTTKEGLEAWMAPHAAIDLRIGGKMRTNYRSDGTVDDAESIENTILSYDPPRMLSIKATKPPASFPFKTSIENMWSVIYFQEVSPQQTSVTVVGHGFDQSEESLRMREHFDRGNAWTIQKLQEYFAKGRSEKRE